MFSTQVIYTANGDLTTLNAILNAIAMVCNDGTTIWAFALVSALWAILSMTTVAAVGAAGSSAGADLTKRAIGILVPFALAIMLTNPTMKTTVTVESGLTGATTSVDHVPVLISFVPATASLVSQIVGQKLEAAMQATGTDYASISATNKGFINPLKTLLTSRTAVLRLGGISSEINSVLGACLNSDSGVNYAQIANHVLFAGNLATDPGPAPLTVWSGVGTQRTSIGMLLAEAAQNTSAIVTDIQVGTNNIATCADAAAQVASDINAALQSDEFKRVVQGAVNSADDPNGAGDFSINGVATAYAAARTANSVTGGLAGGTAQANAETINLLFSELVKNDLDCLRADGTNKSTCLAMAVQANEIERNNIQAAANGFESLMYAGAFANKITAVVIGLGPVIVLFMMWSGVGAGRNMKVAAHMIVWPLLIMNVGAELINGMIYISVANFMRAIAQGGMINQSTAVEVYKNFSLEIGTASHLMATLPILMSTIFALGESAALVKISDSMSSGSKDESKSVNPAPVDATPLVTNSSVAKAEQGIGGADVSMTGAIPAIAASAQFGSMQREASNSISSAHQKMRSISEGTTSLSTWTEAFSTGDFSKTGVSASTGHALREDWNRNYTANQSGKVSEGIGSSKDNFNNTSAGIGVGAEVGAGVGGSGVGPSAGIGGSGDYKTNTGSNDSLKASKNAEQSDSVAASRALSKSFNEFMQSDQYKNLGKDESHNLQRAANVQKQYSDTLSDSKSVSDVASEAVKRSSGFVQLSAKIGGSEVLQQMKTNPDYRRFQLNEGRAFGDSDKAKPYLERARRDMAAGVTDKILGDDQANEAMARHRAAFLMAVDEHAAPADRLHADEYLLGSTNAMLAANFTATDLKPREPYDIAGPADHTGVSKNAIVRAAGRAGGGKPKHGGTGSVNDKLNKDGYEFATGVANNVEKVSDRVLDGRHVAEGAAAGAGLKGNDHKNTRERTRGNIGANFKETLPEFMQGEKKPDRFEVPDKK